MTEDMQEIDTKTYVDELCRQARSASRQLATLTNEQRNAALREIASRLVEAESLLCQRNALDLEAGREAGLGSALLDRLTLNPERVQGMSEGLLTVADLDDPLAGAIDRWRAPSGIDIEQRRIPIGVIGMIYESRPNVTADVTALCVKSGNAVILKGGKEAIHSNSAIAEVVTAGLRANGVPETAVQLVQRTDRETTNELLTRDDSIDLLIPRGGPGLVRAVAQRSSIPIIKHYEGVCNVYVDESADLASAADIVMNAKVQRPGVCNAIENLLVHAEVADDLLADLAPRLQEAGVEVRACPRAIKLISGATAASEDDWSAEYLDLVLAVKVLDSLDEAIEFINREGSGHSDSIVSSNKENAERFLSLVDSAVVYSNASTRFTDGFAFGFGAEIGISTNRIHARGPMALRELTTYKYVVRGQGQVRD